MSRKSTISTISVAQINAALKYLQQLALANSSSGTTTVNSVNGEVGAVTLTLDDIPAGSTNTTITAAEKSTYAAKQVALVSGTNIKTVGGTSLLGSGDISVGVGDVTLNGVQTITNKTISGASNTLSNINADSVIDGTTNKVYTATEKTKLAGISPNATANVGDVLLAGTNVFTDINTFTRGDGTAQVVKIKNTSTAAPAESRIDLFTSNGSTQDVNGGVIFLKSNTLGGGYSNAFGLWNFENGPIVLATNGTEKFRLAANGDLLLTSLAGTGSRLLLASSTGIISSPATVAQSLITNLVSDLAGKQATLVSATNIKTINSTSLLGSGDITTGDVTLAGAQTLTNKTLTSAVLGGTTIFPSTSSGYQYYNTSDQTTNYSRYAFRNPATSSNGLWEFASQNGGSASKYGLEFAVSGSSSFRMGGPNIQGNTDLAAVSFYPQLANVTNRFGVAINSYETMAANSGMQTLLGVFSKIDQVATAGFRSLMISPWINTTGSGVHYLIDAGTNTALAGSGTHTSKFTVTETGIATAIQWKLSALNTAPASATDTGSLGEIRFVNGYLYFAPAANTWLRAALTTW